LSGEWLTYREAAGRLGSNIEAVRQRAIRCRWPRTVGNDKRARIQIPEGLPISVREGNDRAPRKVNDGAYDRLLIKALEAHVETLKAQLAAAEARIDKQADDLVANDTAYAAGLAAERAKVEAERAKAERLAAEFAARYAQHAAELKAEQAQTEKAIAAFSALAERLDALAAERAKPWWRRLVG
jgi:hypothetical protein